MLPSYHQCSYGTPFTQEPIDHPNVLVSTTLENARILEYALHIPIHSPIPVLVLVFCIPVTVLNPRQNWGAFSTSICARYCGFLPDLCPHLSVPPMIFFPFPCTFEALSSTPILTRGRSAMRKLRLVPFILSESIAPQSHGA